ncbi:glycosyltransferase family 87 protein [Mucilaginibacter psychrotolerans]|uniref:DUF2029 domain-containing protein n=1 Tax=Mucilaginibacter psychrotolerans TaxID=1524096 RepID=A0A4Y8SMB6_9SPHI|nr:glycosyltransferase family 87 protein [Mucilaginibacter psychrotolerans]TFF39556.1 DUF2029 domain-containing protein [Mucilaginibacter psychrotolerans]
MVINRYFKIALIVAAIFYAYTSARNAHDFEVFVDAGSKIIQGKNIYTPPFAQDLQYYYSPLCALLLAPFSGLPIIISQLLWIGFSYFLLYRIWILVIVYFDTSQLSKKQMQLWFIISLFLSLRFILVDIGYVQMTIFILWATLESIQLIRRDRYILGSALLALAINIKLLPLAFVFYLLYRNKVKAAVSCCVFYLVFLFLPALYLGWQRNLDLIHNWFTLINPGNKEWTIEAEDGPNSLVALIPVYLMDTTGVLTFKRNFVNLPFHQVSLILNVVRLFFVLLTFAFLRTFPFKAVKSTIRQFWEMSYIFIAVPLLYPHQQQYAFVYIIPALVYLSYYVMINWNMIKQKVSIPLWIVIFVIGVNFSPLIGRDVISGYAFEVLLYVRILPVATILLIPILWICRPKDELKTADQ